MAPAMPKDSFGSPAASQEKRMTSTKSTAHGNSTPPAKAGWINDPHRLDVIMRTTMKTFGIRLSAISFSKSVIEGPLDIVRIDLDRVRNADLEKARVSVGEECVIARRLFSMEVRILPRYGARTSGNRRGPYDKGPADAQTITDLRRRLKKADYADIVLHDNLYGRSIEILEKDRGRYVLRACSPAKITERLRVGPEIIDYLEKGWWTSSTPA